MVLFFSYSGMVHESQGPHKSTLIEQTVKGAIAGS